jgi:hypothetical protein
MIYGKTLDEGLGPEYYVQKLNNFPPSEILWDRSLLQEGKRR